MISHNEGSVQTIPNGTEGTPPSRRVGLYFSSLSHLILQVKHQDDLFYIQMPCHLDTVTHP